MSAAISSRTPEGKPSHCPVCGLSAWVVPAEPLGDAPCPGCGSLLWFEDSAVEGSELASSPPVLSPGTDAGSPRRGEGRTGPPTSGRRVRPDATAPGRRPRPIAVPVGSFAAKVALMSGPLLLLLALGIPAIDVARLAALLAGVALFQRLLPHRPEALRQAAPPRPAGAPGPSPRANPLWDPWLDG